MEEQFKHGELVQVRRTDSDSGEWKKRRYLDTVECKKTGKVWHWTYPLGKGPGNHDGIFFKWNQIRKLQQSELVEHLVDKFQDKLKHLAARVTCIENDLYNREQSRQLDNGEL